MYLENTYFIKRKKTHLSLLVNENKVFSQSFPLEVFLTLHVGLSSTFQLLAPSFPLCSVSSWLAVAQGTLSAW